MAETLERRLYKTIGLNHCVAVRDMRSCLRGGRPYQRMFSYALLGSGAVLLTVYLMAVVSRYSAGGLRDSAGAGAVSFTVLAFVQLALILVELPALSAGAITLEREKHTLDMLRATSLTPFDVVTGKLVGILAFAALLLLTTLPIAAWCVTLGGVPPLTVFCAYSYLLAVAAVVASLGVAMSTMVQRTLGAIVATYAVLAVALAGLPIVFYSVAAALFTVGSAVSPNTGDPTGALLLFVPAALIGVVVFVLARGLLIRVPGPGLGMPNLASVASAVLALVSCGAFIWLIVSLAPSAGAAIGWGVPMAFNPFVCLAAILSGQASAALPFAGPFGATGLVEDFQFRVCAVVTAIAWSLALTLWGLAVKVFQARP